MTQVIKTTLVEGVGWPVFEGLPQRFKHESKPIRTFDKPRLKKKRSAKEPLVISEDTMKDLCEALMDSKDNCFHHPVTKEKEQQGLVLVYKHPLEDTIKELSSFETRKSRHTHSRLNAQHARNVKNGTMAK